MSDGGAYAEAITPLGIRVAMGVSLTDRAKPENKHRWDVVWGRTRRQIADDYIASGAAKRRKDGGWDMRYKASRHVHDVETGEPSIFV